jgi:hypothetical protein
VFANPGKVYAVYAPQGGAISIDLAAGEYSVSWYDPRLGGALRTGDVTVVQGGDIRSIGAPPSDTQSDWAALIRSTSGEMAEPDLVVTPTTLGFGAVMPGAFKTLPITLVNEGSADLSIESFEMAGTNPLSFSIQQDLSPFTLLPGQSIVVQVTFSPGAADSGTKSALLRINSNDPGNAFLNVSLNGSVATGSDGGDGDGGDGDGGNGGGGDGQSGTISVTGFTLINAETCEELGNIQEGDIIELSDLPTIYINIRADTEPLEVGSVQFALNRNANFQMENSSPYSMAGDIGDEYNAWTRAGSTKRSSSRTRSAI